MFNKLLKNSFIYVLGDVLNKSIPFFMLPILTRYLSPGDYGIIASFSALVSVFAVCSGLSVHGAVNVNFFRMGKEELKEYIGNTIIILNVSTLIIFVITFIISPIIGKRLSLPTEWILIAVILAFSQFLTTINLVLWTAEQKPKQYTIYQLSQTLLLASLSLMFIVALKMDWKGQLIAQSIGTILFAGFSFLFIIKRGYLRFKLNKEYVSDALKFGIPLIPHQLSMWLKTGSDRMILMALVGSAQTGIYSVGYQLGMVINVLVTAFNKAWSPYLFRVLADNPKFETKLKLVKFTYIYMVSIMVIALIFSFSTKYIIPIFLGKKFVAATAYLIYFSIAFAFQGMYSMVGNYVFYAKKTNLVAYVTFTTSLLHVAMTYTFVKMYGSIGAAYSTVISYFLTFIAMWYLNNKVYPMPWFFGNMSNK
ncbi:flippase [Sphaerochaeta sp.]|uniref:flippase n=1 Tax=Sphaerochaeta sp. TaxID=1972642 RepID=UPI003D0B4850